MPCRALLASALLLAAPLSAWAQGLDEDSAFLCFRGGPASRCSSFLIIEFSYATRLNRTTRANPGYYDNDAFSWEAGWMKNTGERLALGGTVFYGPGEDRLGLKSRLRWWLSREVSVDLGGGVLLKNDVMDPGLTGHLGLNLVDVLQAFTQVEVLRFKSGSTDTAWWVGVKGGSYIAVLSVVVVLIGLAAYSAG